MDAGPSYSSPGQPLPIPVIRLPYPLVSEAEDFGGEVGGVLGAVDGHAS